MGYEFVNTDINNLYNTLATLTEAGAPPAEIAKAEAAIDAFEALVYG